MNCVSLQKCKSLLINTLGPIQGNDRQAGVRRRAVGKHQSPNKSKFFKTAVPLKTSTYLLTQRRPKMVECVEISLGIDKYSGIPVSMPVLLPGPLFHDSLSVLTRYPYKVRRSESTSVSVVPIAGPQCTISVAFYIQSTKVCNFRLQKRRKVLV